MKVVGLDVGYGYVKLYADGVRKKFPSSVSRDTSYLLDRTGHVKFNGSEFVVGGEGVDLRSDDYPFTEEYKALVLYALSLLFPKEREGEVALALGIPPGLKSEENRKRLMSRFRRKFEFEVEGRKLTINVPVVRVYLQGWGGYRDYTYTLELKKVKEHFVPSIFSDWGFRTIDTIILDERIERGDVVLKPRLPHATPTISKGVSYLLDIYKSLLRERKGVNVEDTRRAERLFIAGRYPEERKEALGIWKKDVLRTILSTYSGEVPDLERLVIFGGGANLVEEEVRKIRWNGREILVVKLDEFANARGYYKNLKMEMMLKGVSSP